VEEAAQLEHLLRIPYWPYWPAVLAMLYARRADVARVAGRAAAKVCELWLRVTPDEVSPGRQMPWRREVAELAIEIARELQTSNSEGPYYSAGHDKIVYQAMLLGAPYFPDKATALCLELAARRDLPPEVVARGTQAREKRRRGRAERATSAAPPVPPLMRLRERQHTPWPDGPRGRIDHEFREVCLSGSPFIGLIKAAPEVALEVLLAVSIEEPRDDDFYGRSSLPECGLSYWRDGDPPAYFRGPFHSFFKLAPEQALTYVIKIANFGTHRYTEDRYWQDITVDGKSNRWYGDANVYRWHHDWPLMHGSQIESSLMALEQWLYEEIDQGRPIEKWIERIVAESESIAFAGVLMDVGKRAPELFATVLKPLFFTWQLWKWDFELAIMHSQDRQYIGGYWGQQPRQLIEMARTFHLLPHRAEALIAPNGAIPRTMLGHEHFRDFIESVRTAWSMRLQDSPDAKNLRLLIERINPKNYKFEQKGNEIVPVDFDWPTPIAQENAEELRKLSYESTITTLPWRARKWLDEARPLPPDQRQWLWDFLQSFESKVGDQSDEPSAERYELLDATIAGIALLLSTSRAWLDEDPRRIAWCRQKLQRTVDHPPPSRDSEVAIGDQQWDSFAAECGVLLLTENSEDALARSLVAGSVTAFRYATTTLTMRRAARVRRQLGDEFSMMVALAIRWAALRPLQARRADSAFDTDRAAFLARKRALVQEFVDKTLSSRAPDLSKLNAETRDARDALYEKQFPGTITRRKRGSASASQELHSEPLGLDTYVMKAALSWLDMSEVQTAGEKSIWLAHLQELLRLVLHIIPIVAPESRQKIEGLRSDFDSWLFQMIARAIPRLASAKDGVSLWKPILERGASAHKWVERFFWYWFTDGLTASASPAEFIRLWRPMIVYALSHKGWDPSTARSHDLDSVVLELLGLDRLWSGLFRDEENTTVVASLQGIYDQAFARFGASAMVMSGFTAMAVLPASKELLLPGIRWLRAAVDGFHSYDWRHGLEDNVLEFLHVCWTQKRAQISTDPTLREAFLAILAVVTSRGTPAAIALNKRVAETMGP
jgi:hypothetical protein